MHIIEHEINNIINIYIYVKITNEYNTIVKIQMIVNHLVKSKIINITIELGLINNKQVHGLLYYNMVD
jgi:hypothetical protein